MAARTVLPVPGAELALVEASRAARNGRALDAAATTLAAHVSRLDLSAAERASCGEGRGVLIAAEPDGPALAVRWFHPGEPTTIHGHGSWGVSLVCRGSVRHERFAGTDPGVRLAMVREVDAGGWSTWAVPPDDVHRQTAGADGGLELVLAGAAPEPEPRAVAVATGVLEQSVTALASYDFPSLAAHYRDDVLLDANVPQWRYQLQGRAAVLEVAHEELGGLEQLRVTDLRASYADDLAVVEVAVRFGAPTREHRWREVHLLRREDEAIVEHTLYCTGIWDPAAIAKHAAEAPMVRP